MLNIPSARLTIPKAINGELVRHKLIDAILNSPAKAVYIHGGAGYGKTTLLSQVARNVEKAVWLSLDGENDIFTFVDTFCAAVKQTFPEFDFSASEYLPFCEKNNFISILAGALISTIENILVNFIVVMNDLHTIVEEKVKKLILYLIKHPPKNVKFCFGSRETLPQDLLPFKIKGNLIELTQNELAFTREEITNILGFCDSSIYDYTEGWPLAICFFKVLLENSKPISNISSYSKETLYTYLFNECIANLSPDMVDFLKKSACFDELEAQMLDEVLNKKDTKLMLESLVSRNIFTVKTSEGFYRYHALFRSSLLDMADKNETSILMQKATRYYFDHKQYSRAAKYAIDSKDYKLLHKIILTCYRDYIKAGNFSELGIWFKALDDASVVADPLILVAKGAYLSFIGNFVQANACLEAAIPLMNENDKLLYFEAMIHKARVLRNFVSFEQSNKLLDELIEKLDNSADELAYSVVIEKLYNLCWNSQIDEAYTLARHMIEKCANAGNIKVKRWFERYLCTICFFKGNMKKSVYYYEKLLDLNEDEQNFLGVHSTAIYVAKAYQMMGDRSRSLSVLSQELSRLRNTGNYEEMWAGYLLAAEICRGKVKL